MTSSLKRALLTWNWSGLGVQVHDHSRGKTDLDMNEKEFPVLTRPLFKKIHKVNLTISSIAKQLVGIIVFHFNERRYWEIIDCAPNLKIFAKAPKSKFVWTNKILIIVFLNSNGSKRSSRLSP